MMEFGEGNDRSVVRRVRNDSDGTLACGDYKVPSVTYW